MATNGSKSVSVTKWDTLKFEWSVSSQSVANNTSNVAWKLLLITTGSGRIDSTKAKSYTIKVNGVSYTGTNYIGIGNNQTKTLVSGNTVIKHNTDGSKSFPYSFTQEFDITFSSAHIDTISGSGTGTLNNIPRQATITAAPNFNDEENPTITYSNPAGTAVSKLQACISLTGSVDNVVYRDISKTGTSYTFELTDADRSMLRYNTNSGSTKRTVYFIIATTIGGTIYKSTLAKTFTVVNCFPEIETTLKDVGSASTQLTGNDSTMIKGFNYILASMSSTLYKGATIASQTITNGGSQLIGATGGADPMEGGFNNAETPIFIYSLTDSRGQTATRTITMPMIDYFNLTCDLVASAPTTDGVMAIKVSGNYFIGSFGAVDNYLALEYRLKANSGDWGAWHLIEDAYTIGNGKYSVDSNISGLDYRNTYTIQVRAQDRCLYVESATKTVKTIPVFDWGENDFNYNVPVNIEGDLTADNVSVDGDISGTNASFTGSGTFGSVVSNGAVSGTNASFTGNISASGTATLKDSRGKTLTGGELVTNTYTGAFSVANGTNVSKLLFTAPVTGLYIITATITWASNANGARTFGIMDTDNSTYLSSSTFYAHGTGGIQQNATAIIRLTQGQKINARVWQNSGGALNAQWMITRTARIGA